jgi:hypothetical protein
MVVAAAVVVVVVAVAQVVGCWLHIAEPQVPFRVILCGIFGR